MTHAITLIDTEPLLMRVGGESNPAIPLASTNPRVVHSIAGDMTRDMAPLEVTIAREHRRRVTHRSVHGSVVTEVTSDDVQQVKVRTMRCLVDRVTGCIYCAETGVCLSSAQMWLS